MCFNFDTPSLMNGNNAADENELTNGQMKAYVMWKAFFEMVLFCNGKKRKSENFR